MGLKEPPKIPMDASPDEGKASPDPSEGRGVFCWVMLFDGFIGDV
jgi:hypothetical protein